jgi:hypothetical protein
MAIIPVVYSIAAGLPQNLSALHEFILHLTFVQFATFVGIDCGFRSICILCVGIDAIRFPQVPFFIFTSRVTHTL